MLIAPLSAPHVDAVARLHCASLTGLLSQLGVPAARAYYGGCVKTDAAIGLVCIDGDTVRGFVLGSIHPDALKQAVVRNNLVATLAGLCAGIVRRPVALKWLLASMRRPDDPGYDPQAPELTYLAVAADCRQAGIGKRLVDAFSAAMRHAGARGYELSVDDDNVPAIAFYERLRFQLIGRYREFGILHRRYRLEC